jgi:hypothetical protein
MRSAPVPLRGSSRRLRNCQIPASYIFSYWLFFWALGFIVIKYAYYFANVKIPTQIEWFNPTLVIIVALIWTSESWISLFINGFPIMILLKYGLSIVFLKAVPLLFVWTWDVSLYRDVSISLILFAIYCVYLWLNGTDLFAVYQDLTKSIENDEDRTPFEYQFERLLELQNLLSK